jgi:putative ABC transport system substrate-binding protein
MRLCLRRREFNAGLSSAAAWPLAAGAQQRAMPVIGFLSSRTTDSDASMLVSFRRGLADVGYAEGRNVAVEYRFADGLYNRVSAKLTDLTQRKVGVIVLAGPGAIERLWRQVRASPIPIVFSTGGDPLRLGYVASMNRPGRNMTGVASLVAEVSGKRLSLLHDLVPKAATIAVLVDPGERSREIIELQDARDAAAALGQKLLVLDASTAEEIDAQFARLDQEPADAMLVMTSPFFVTRARQIAVLAASSRSTHGASLPKLAAS